jgi:hypothetical protein
MKVKCITETLKQGVYNQKIVEWAKKSELEITQGKIYVVLAISKYLDALFYYILGDESESYPLAFPSELFEIVESKISKYWDTNLKQIISLEDIEIKNNDIISFKEWAINKDIFYENLLEENENEVAIFNSYKDKMILE